MPPSPQWYESTKTSQISSDITPTVAAGASVAAVAYWLFDDKGSLLGATVLTSPRVGIEAWDGVSWVRSGMPILDEGWVEVAITGVDKTGDAGMASQTTSYAVLASGRELALTTISVGCGREITLRIVVPLGASEHGRTFRLYVVPSGSPTAVFSGNMTIAGTLVVTGAATFSDVASGSVAYAAGNFTASAGSWTVDAGDQLALHFVKLWKLLTVWFDIATTDVSATPSDLRIALPNGYVSAGIARGKFTYADAGGAFTTGEWVVVASGTFISLNKAGFGSNWTATSSDNTRVFGTVVLRIS